jgi:hypothetical protein
LHGITVAPTKLGGRRLNGSFGLRGACSVVCRKAGRKRPFAHHMWCARTATSVSMNSGGSAPPVQGQRVGSPALARGGNASTDLLQIAEGLGMGLQPVRETVEPGACRRAAAQGEAPPRGLRIEGATRSPAAGAAGLGVVALGYGIRPGVPCWLPARRPGLPGPGSRAGRRPGLPVAPAAGPGSGRWWRP